MAEETGGLDAALGGMNPFKRAGAKKKSHKAKTPAPAKPKSHAAKKDLSNGFALVWGMTGSALAMGDGLRYTGRLMQVQAPIAGRDLNKYVRSHDLLYRVLSPIFGVEELGLLTNTFGPPLVVAMLERNPGLFPVLQPLVVPMLWDLYKEVKKNEARQEEIMREITEGGEESTVEFQAFMASLGFGEPEPEPSPEPEGEAAAFEPIPA